MAPPIQKIWFSTAATMAWTIFMALIVSTSLHEELVSQLMEAQLQSHRILARVREPLHARIKPGQLILCTLPDRT